MVPCVRQMLHKWPGRKLVSQFNNRNKMSFIPKKKKEEQKQRNTWVAFGLETESSILAEAQCWWRASRKGGKFRVEYLAASVFVISHRKGSCAKRDAGWSQKASRAQPSGHQVREAVKNWNVKGLWGREGQGRGTHWGRGRRQEKKIKANPKGTWKICRKNEGTLKLCPAS